MVKILHGADFHLDTPFESLPPEKAARMRRDQRRMLMEMAELARSEGVELALFSGDLLDSGLSYYETWEALCAALEAMAVPVFIAPGNHDHIRPSSPYIRRKLPVNVHVFTSQRISVLELPRLGVRVYGAGFTADRCSPLLDGFRAKQDDFINIMTIHGERSGKSYNPITNEQIEQSGLDYLALGHVHSFSGINRVGRTAWAYPGCPMGRGFDETGEKGVIIGSVGHGETKLKFHPLHTRHYTIISAGEQDWESTLDAADPNDIVRLVLTGSWTKKPDLKAIYDRYGDNFFHLVLRDESVSDRDIWQDMTNDDLRGLFLRNLREQYSLPGADRELIELAAEYGLAAVQGREEPGQ